MPDQLIFNTISAIKAAQKATQFCPGWGNGEGRRVLPAPPAGGRLEGCCWAACSSCMAAASGGWMGSPKPSQGPQQPDSFEEPWGFRRWSIKSYLWPICEPADSAWQTHGRSDSQKGMVVFIFAALSICNVVTFDKNKEGNKTL